MAQGLQRSVNAARATQGKPPVLIDATTRQQLAEALECVDYCMEGMITATAFGREGPMVLGCCRATQLLRRAMKRLGIDESTGG